MFGPYRVGWGTISRVRRHPWCPFGPADGCVMPKHLARHAMSKVWARTGLRRVLIVGGVAGGACCAAQLRRLDESVEIVVFDRGPFVSFANCGLPYYVRQRHRGRTRPAGGVSGIFFRQQIRTSGCIRDTEVLSLRIGALRCARPVARRRTDSPVRASIVDLPGVFAIRSIPLRAASVREWSISMPQRPWSWGAASLG